jgi:serine/threonine-protein kinase HipA
MTPLYDILTAQPALNARQIERKQMKLAMSIGNKRYYRFDQVHGRHFVQTGIRAGLSKKRSTALIEEVAETAPVAFETAFAGLPKDFPPAVAEAVHDAVKTRIGGLTLTSALSD